MLHAARHSSCSFNRWLPSSRDAYGTQSRFPHGVIAGWGGPPGGPDGGGGGGGGGAGGSTTILPPPLPLTSPGSMPPLPPPHFLLPGIPSTPGGPGAHHHPYGYALPYGGSWGGLDGPMGPLSPTAVAAALLSGGVDLEAAAGALGLGLSGEVPWGAPGAVPGPGGAMHVAVGRGGSIGGVGGSGVLMPYCGEVLGAPEVRSWRGVLALSTETECVVISGLSVRAV